MMVVKTKSLEFYYNESSGFEKELYSVSFFSKNFIKTREVLVFVRDVCDDGYIVRIYLKSKKDSCSCCPRFIEKYWSFNFLKKANPFCRKNCFEV